MGGLRLDLLGLTSKPGTNPGILASSLAINTASVPTNVPQWSPRIGFNWDVTGDQSNQLRGGTGVFVGNPAYVWLSDLFGNSGVNGYANLACTNFTTAPAMQNAGQPTPTNCKGSTGTPAVTLNTTDPNLKFPSTWRSSIGYDRRLPWNTIGTIEGLYTRQVQNFYYSNIGLVKDPIGHDLNGRAVYGDIASATANPVPTRPAGVTGDVIDISNQSTHDYAYSLTEKLVKRFSNNFEASAAYTYSRSYDVWDVTSSVAFSNWQFGRSLSGREDAQELAPSKWDAPHRFAVSGEYTLPTKTGVSLTWIGESGVPFEYVYGSDMNGDNSASNDLLYVPKNAHDTTQIRFTANGTVTPAAQADLLESFISSHPCLDSQRGTIMKRNSCRTPWDKVVNLSARQTLPDGSGQEFHPPARHLQLPQPARQELGLARLRQLEQPGPSYPAVVRRRAGPAAQDRQRRAAGVHLQRRESVHDAERVVELRAAAPAQVSVLEILASDAQRGRHTAPPFVLRIHPASTSISSRRSSINFRRSAINLRRSAITLRQSSITLRQSAITLRQSAITLRRSAITLRQSATNPRRSSISDPRSPIND